MADAAAMSGGEKTPEQQPPPPVWVESSGGLSAEEKRAEAGESPQNGVRFERSRSDEESLLEDKGSPRSGHRKGSVSEGLLPKPAEDLPLKKNFQIPRKTREKKALFQPITKESREFEDVMNILHSSYLEIHSKDNFIYKKASLVHSELLEKEFIEKRRELKRDGRSEKEVAETYAFLKVDRSLVQNICENGLQAGHSKITVLGSPSLGVYLSRYADLLQTNPLEANATGDIIIFKVIKGKMKTVFENLGVNQMDSTAKSALDPTPKYECHVSKSANRITSLFSYRAYERTQYYFYEYGFDEIRPRPRHICPYAVVSFSYKEEKGQKYSPQARAKNSNMDKSADKTSYTLWNGQLLNRGTLVCHAALKSETRPLLPCKLPEKLDVEMVMSIDRLTQTLSPRILSKETYSGEREEFRNGLYCSLYQVVEKARSGSNLEGLLQKLETDKLVIVKPLIDRGYLLLLSSYQTASLYENPTGKPHTLQALFLLRHPRGILTSAHRHGHKNENTSELQESHVIMPKLVTFIQSLHYAYVHSRKDPKSDLNAVIEKYINDYLKRYSKHKEFVLYQYKDTLDEKRHLFAGPKNKSHLESSLRSYIFDPEAYQIPISKATKIMSGHRKPQQLSPDLDYEVPDEEFDYTKRKASKRNGSECETVAAKRQPDQLVENDPVRLEQLINLIYDKKNAGKESDAEDSKTESRLKRKLESRRDSLQKHLKTSGSPESSYQYEGSRASETVHSMIAALGGHDTDLRQNVSEPSVTDYTGVLKLISELLTNADSSLGRLGKQSSGENYSRQNAEYHRDPPQVKQELEIPDQAHIENIPLRDPQSPVKLDISAQCLPYSLDISTTEEDATFHVLRLKDASTGSVSSFDGCNSPCSSTPIEQNCHRQHSSSDTIETTGIHWKLIPITGGAGRVREEQLREHGDNQTGLKSREELLAYSAPKDASENDPRIISRQRSSDYPSAYSSFSDLHKGRIEDRVCADQEVKCKDQCELQINRCAGSEHSINGIIETAILEEYSHFTNKIQDILQQKNIMYASAVSRPVISVQERLMRLSEYLCLQASDTAVQEYVERLSEKLNSVILSSVPDIRQVPFTCAPEQAPSLIPDTRLNSLSEELVSLASDSDMGPFPEPPCNNVKEESDINEQNELAETEKQQSPVIGSIETKTVAESNISTVEPPLQDKSPKVVGNANVTTQTAVAGLINQLNPEIFDNFFKIMQDVRKNSVKFYIYEEQENALCREIKDYLIQLGNSECHPEHFLRGRANNDKLLIIIQNEDIASLIHKIPCLVALKRLSCVSFAGVDSLDDMKNRTYNKLFVSGGFIVSDESVLNPESVSVDKLSTFLKFLEDLSTPRGKWQWKVHYKIQKKLKELERTNVNAGSLLTLLSTYEKKHVVEILSYHSCDSQTRNPPELDCLIKLQAQNIQQRHIVFLTEKNVSTFASYASNGIVVTTMSFFMQSFKNLVGHHYSITGEIYSPSPIDHERQSALVENEKDEEDMSLDSGDEASQIEVCNDTSKYDSHLEALETEAKGSHGTGTEQNSQSDALLSTEGGSCFLTGRTSKIEMQDIQPVTPAPVTCSMEGEITNSAKQIPLSNFQICNRQLSVPHQFSHFNVLTHQTFLGTTYPMSTSQNQGGGNYFLTTYSQNMDMNQSSSPSSWDINYNSSRPFSKQN